MPHAEHVPLVQSEATEEELRNASTVGAHSCGRARAGGLVAVLLLIAVIFATHGSGIGLRSVGKSPMQVKSTSAYPTIGILSWTGTVPSQDQLAEIAEKLPREFVLVTVCDNSDWSNDFSALIQSVAGWDAYLYVDGRDGAGHEKESRDHFILLNRKMTRILSFVHLHVTRLFYLFEKPDADIEKELASLGDRFSIEKQVGYRSNSAAMFQGLSKLGKAPGLVSHSQTSDLWHAHIYQYGSAILMPDVKYTFMCQGTDRTVEGFVVTEDFLKKGDDGKGHEVVVKMVEPVTMYRRCLLLKNQHGPAQDVDIIGWGTFGIKNGDVTLPAESKLRLFGGPMLDPNPFVDTALPGDATYEDVVDKISELEALGTVFACWAIAGQCQVAHSHDMESCDGQWLEMKEDNFEILLEERCQPIILVDYVIPEKGDNVDIASVLG